MAQIDRTRLKEIKQAVSERLASVKLKKYHLRRVDRRLETYCRAVCTDPEGHNLWEQLAVERFLAMCDKYGIAVDVVKCFYLFYESLQFPGATGPTRFRLTPVQCFQFAAIYGFWDGGERVVKTAVLYVPRKFSKTTSSAAFAIWDLLYGDANAESYTGANSADQAKKCFDVIRYCVRGLDPGEKRFVVNELTIKTLGRQRTAKAQCLTANARTKDGLNASTNIMDEFSQARDANLLNVLVTSMGVRRNPLTVIITTASDVYDGPFYTMLQGYKAILLGDAPPDDSTFVHLFEPDVDDREDSEATWRKVHPHLGVTVSMEFYRREWLKAQREGAETLMAFRTKLLNVYASNERTAWITRELAMKCARSMDIAAIPPGCTAMLGIDLSKCNDLTAMATAILNPATHIIDVYVDYYFPRDALPGHTDEELLRKWAAEGHLHLVDGDTIDYVPIVARINEIARRVTIAGIGYDAYGSVDMATYLRTCGLGGVLFAVPQSYGYFKGPMFALEKAMREHRLYINDNPINYFCFANAVVDENLQGEMKPVKRTPSAKIDGVIAMLMAMRQFLYWKH